jgi:hypothetical protein
VDSKERAKRVIVEIVRQAGGMLQNRSDLFDAFYHAHLIYAEAHPGYLSTWRMVKAPDGPAIDRVDELLGELVADGFLRDNDLGGHYGTSFPFEFVGDRSLDEKLESEEADAIAAAVKIVQGHSGTRVSANPHALSRAWRDAAIGEELAIYCDSVPENEFQERHRSMEIIVAGLKAAWSTPVK